MLREDHLIATTRQVDNSHSFRSPLECFKKDVNNLDKGS